MNNATQNNQTKQIIRFLTGIGSGLVTIAHAKMQDPSLVYARMKARNTAFRLALASTVAAHGRQFSLSTLSKVDWKEVAAAL